MTAFALSLLVIGTPVALVALLILGFCCLIDSHRVPELEGWDSGHSQRSSNGVASGLLMLSMIAMLIWISGGVQ